MFHKAIALTIKEETAFEVTFQSGEVKLYDISKLFAKYPPLEALKDRSLFETGRLESAYGIRWTDELDLDTETVYEDGILVREEKVQANYLAAYAVSVARKEAKMTQTELAEATGIDQSDISKIERGVSNPSVTTLQRLAEAMGMELKITIE